MRRRVLTTEYRRWVDPELVFPALYGAESNSFWLDSGIGATGGRSYLGAASRVFVPAAGESVLEFLRAELSADRAPVDSPPSATGFRLGWVGWLGYDDDKIRQLCREALDEGWTRFKLKVGADVEDDRRRAARTRATLRG